MKSVHVSRGGISATGDLLGGVDLFRLDGRIALVTGAAGYLGTAIASTLAQAGAVVWLNGRDESKLVKLADKLTGAGLDARPLAFDVTDAAARSTGLEELAAHSDRLDVLVNNAHQPRSSSFLSAETEDFAHAALLGVAAAHALIKGVLPLLKQAATDSSPSVINVASIYGMVSPDPHMYTDEQLQNPPYYGAAKAALLQLTRHAATHLGSQGIRVNAISPGPFPASTTAADPQLPARLAQRIPLGRIGQPDELRTAVMFLASPASTFVTGINLPVDGGWTAW